MQVHEITRKMHTYKKKGPYRLKKISSWYYKALVIQNRRSRK